MTLDYYLITFHAAVIPSLLAAFVHIYMYNDRRYYPMPPAPGLSPVAWSGLSAVLGAHIRCGLISPPKAGSRCVVAATYRCVAEEGGREEGRKIIIGTDGSHFRLICCLLAWPSG